MTTQLGRTYRDTVSGFAGVVTGRAEYLSGSTQALVVAHVEADGRYVRQWFDEQRLVEIPARPVA